MTEQKLYTLPEVAKLAGIEYRTLFSWVQRGIFHPSLTVGTNTRHKHICSEKDLAIAKILQRLRANGLGIDKLRLVSAELKYDEALCPVCGGQVPTDA